MKDIRQYQHSLNEHKPVKVLLITHEYGRRVMGGLGRVVNGIFGHMSGTAIDIFQIKFPFQITTETAPVLLSEDRNDFAYVYRRDESKVRCLASGNFRVVLENAMISEGYDIVHIIVHSPVTAECLKIVKASFPHVKTLYSCHSMVKNEMTVRNNSPHELRPEEYIVNTVDHIHLLNKTSLGYLEENYSHVAHKGQFSIVPNGIEAADFVDGNSKFKEELKAQVEPEKNKVVFCLSRWSHGKGLEYLLDAVPQVTREFTNVRFIIAGRKEQSWENEMKEYVNWIDEKIERESEHVIPLGWLDDQCRNTVFAMADICVMPSMLEYFPYSILEPMVCQVPIVSSKIKSVEELLDEPEECLFYTPTNAAELAEKICYLLKHQEVGNSMAVNAFDKVKQEYNWDTVCQQYVKMYNTLSMQGADAIHKLEEIVTPVFTNKASKES